MIIIALKGNSHLSLISQIDCHNFIMSYQSIFVVYINRISIQTLKFDGLLGNHQNVCYVDEIF
jgi:hypothetical protein